MRRVSIGVVLILLAALALPGTARADDIALQKIFRNAMYGGALGALVGGALLAFKDKPGDHWDFITIGAASGVLVGAAWGIYDSSTRNPYVSIENGRIHAALPLPEVTRWAPSEADRGRTETLVTTRLVGVRF